MINELARSLRTGRVQVVPGLLVASTYSVIHAGQRAGGAVAVRRRESVPSRSRGSWSAPGTLRESSPSGTRRLCGDGEVLGDGEAGSRGRSEAPLDGELAAALAAPAEQFAGVAAWAADEARSLDHGEREKLIPDEGRDRTEAAAGHVGFYASREERAAGSRALRGSGTAASKRLRAGPGLRVGPVPVTRMAYRTGQEPNLHPADARQAS